MTVALTDEQLIKHVRSVVAGSTTELPDDQILYFAGRGDDESWTYNILDSSGNLNLWGIYADAYTYIARDDRYMSETEGAVSVSQPTALKWAAYYRARADDIADGGFSVGVVTRKDVGYSYAQASDKEFGLPQFED